MTEAGIGMEPAEIVVSAALDEIGKARKEEGLPLQELIDRGRKIRGDLAEEEYGISDDEPE